MRLAERLAIFRGGDHRTEMLEEEMQTRHFTVNATLA